MLENLHILAATYGTGSYNSNVYGVGGPSGSLVDTGAAVAVVAAVAVIIVLSALLVFWRKKAPKTPTATE